MNDYTLTSAEVEPGEADNAYMLQSSWTEELLDLDRNLTPFDPTENESLAPVRSIGATDLSSITERSLETPSEVSMSVNVEKTLRRGSLSPSIADIRETPSLCSEVSTIEASLALSRANDVLVNGGSLDEEGRLVTSRPQLQCEFWYLDCSAMFDFVDFQEWHDHCKSHLGRHEPPRDVSCPLMHCFWTYRHSDGERAWCARREHLEEEHLLNGMSMRLWKPKVASTLLQHLWRHEIICSAQRQILISEGCGLVAPAAFIQSHGERSAETRRNRPRTMHRGPRGYL